MVAIVVGQGAATPRFEPHELQIPEERVRSARRGRGSLKEPTGADFAITNCTTRENSCDEDEESHLRLLHSPDEEGPEVWNSLSESSAGGASSVGSNEPFEHPFTAVAPEGAPLSDSAKDKQADVDGRMRLAPQPSAGSALHGSGRCRPCAWYWKPGGCVNGAGCRHCHECSEGEIQRRKKSKAREIHRSNARKALSEEVLCQRPPGSFVARAPSPVTVSAQSLSAPPGPPGLELPDDEMLPARLLRPPPGLEFEPMAAGEAAPVVQLPSVGSSLHAVGMCKPCAWYWKLGGCQNSQECNHCHLCSPGELAARKRAKTAAMRAGAMQRCGLNDRDPRTMRISTFLAERGP